MLLFFFKRVTNEQKYTNILTESRIYDIIKKYSKKGLNDMKLSKKDNLNNINMIKELCQTSCDETERANLRKFYINKYGTYMSSKVASVLMLEFFIMFLILQFDLDSIWSGLGVAYADTIVYGALWSSGGIYLLHMVITIVLNTYYLQLALESGKVYKNEVSIDLHEYDTSEGDKKDIYHMYIKQHGKNELISVYVNNSKHRKTKFVSNILVSDNPGTKLNVYFVHDKCNTIFFIFLLFSKKFCIVFGTLLCSILLLG